MTPEQIDTVTNGLINLHTFLDEHGPGLFAAAVAGGCWIVVSRIRARRARRRREIHRGIQHLERYANHPGARRLLDDIHNQPREEEL
jgi:hypothetical protein